MKQIHRVFGLAVILLTAHGFTETQQTQLNNLTSAEYQTQFNKLVSHGYRPIKIWSKALQVIDYQPGETPRLGFWGRFERVPSTTPWVARHGITGGAYQREFETWTRQGYMPTDINVAYLNGRASYCVIFDKVDNQPAWQARHGLNYSTYQNINTSLINQGYRRRITSSCPTPLGPLYAALWAK